MFFDAFKIGKRTVTKPLGRILSWNFAVTAFLPVIIITILVLYQFTSDKLDDIAEKNLLIARAVKGQVEVFLNEPIAVLQNIRNHLVLDPGSSNLEVTNILRNHVRNSRHLESIYIINPHGIVSNVGFKTEKERFEEDYLGISMVHKDFYREARKAEDPAWSDTFLSLISGKMSLALSLAVDERVIVGNFNIGILSSFIDKINIEKGVVITIIDRSGAIIAQSGSIHTGRQIKIGHLELFKSGLAGIEDTQNYTFDDIDYIGSVTWVPGPGWVAAVSHKTAGLYHPLYVVGGYIIAGAVSIIILSILFGIVNSRKLSKPLGELRQSAKDVAKGNYDPQWGSSVYTEIEDLTGSLQQMVNDIKDREHRYRMLFEKASDAIFIVERHTGSYLDANEAGMRLSGRSLSELKQLTTEDVTPIDAQKRLEIATTTHNTADLGKVVYHRPDGTTRTALLTTVPIDDNTVFGMARDITDELELEDHLRQAMKMEAIGTLAGGIAHDFNNILSAILGYSELLLADLPSDAVTRNKLEAIHKSGERARDLVAQILAFSRNDEQVRSPVRLDLVIEETLKLLRPAIPSTIKIQTEISTKSNILGDPSRIHQIIMNLCTNAYQAMFETGGLLNISLCEVKKKDSSAVDNPQIPPGHYGKLIVSDTGIGISSENLSRIFDPYFTTKAKGKGTGLGLAAVHGIVKSHGGFIFVKSQVGIGTRFEVFLPLSSREYHIDEQDKSQLVSGNERILLVDDEPDIREIQKEMLEKQGYLVTAKESATDALNAFSRHPDDFDLVITDMTMPDLAGDKLAGNIMKIRPGIPIILCTGYSELISKEMARSMGIKGFLMKPVTAKDLSDMIRSVLDETPVILRE